MSNPNLHPAVQAVLDRPVFVVGSPRSGTTWVQRLLLSHPAIAGGQESHFFCYLAPLLQHYQYAQNNPRGVGFPAYWSEAQLHEEVRRWWYMMMAPLVDPARTQLLVEKTPQHACYMESIVQLLPESRFIHVIRDSRGVAASFFAVRREDWGQHWAPQEPVAAARMWSHHVRCARTQGQILGRRRYLEVFYEDLLRRPEEGVSRMLDFLGLPADDDLIAQIVKKQEFHAQRSSGGSAIPRPAAASAHHPEPAGFFRQGTADGWKRELTFRQRFIMWRHTRRLLRACGYSWSGRRAPEASPPRQAPMPQATATRPHAAG